MTHRAINFYAEALKFGMNMRSYNTNHLTEDCVSHTELKVGLGGFAQQKSCRIGSKRVICSEEDNESMEWSNFTVNDPAANWKNIFMLLLVHWIDGMAEFELKMHPYCCEILLWKIWGEMHSIAGGQKNLSRTTRCTIKRRTKRSDTIMRTEENKWWRITGTRFFGKNRTRTSFKRHIKGWRDNYEEWRWNLWITGSGLRKSVGRRMTQRGWERNNVRKWLEEELTEEYEAEVLENTLCWWEKRVRSEGVVGDDCDWQKKICGKGPVGRLKREWWKKICKGNPLNDWKEVRFR